MSGDLSSWFVCVDVTAGWMHCKNLMDKPTLQGGTKNYPVFVVTVF